MSVLRSNLTDPGTNHLFFKSLTYVPLSVVRDEMGSLGCTVTVVSKLVSTSKLGRSAVTSALSEPWPMPLDFA